MADLQILPHHGVRTCRPCLACCVHLPIPPGMIGPGEKPAGIRCTHLGARGCRIYNRRPTMCANFRCAWLNNASWPETWRPDRSGLLCLREPIAGRVAAAVYEICLGALQKPAATEILDALQRTTDVVAVVDARQRRWCLPGRQAETKPDSTVAAAALQRGA
ncbi:MAG: hypothetical protein JXB62_16515 [Pirellulales bacterium]|nr:hypothetical protein [Pirellulales bacterium]